MEYDNQNRLILFRNDKGDNEKRPDLNGEIDIEGKKYSFSLWAKKGKSGQTFYAGPIEAKEEVFEDAKQAVAEAPDEESQIPF